MPIAVAGAFQSFSAWMVLGIQANKRRGAVKELARRDRCNVADHEADGRSEICRPAGRPVNRLCLSFPVRIVARARWASS